MGCTGSGAMTEFEFVRSLNWREADECTGPLVSLAFSAPVLGVLEETLLSEHEYELVWDGAAITQTGDRLAFELCATHWLDVSYRAGLTGRRLRRSDISGLASALLENTCRAADWDPKEIANLFTWRRVSLT